MARKPFGVRTHMIRKLFTVMAATAVPLGAVTLDASTASAYAPPLPSPPLACQPSGTLTFPPPALSRQGSASPTKISTTILSPLTYAPGPECGTGGNSPFGVINAKSALKCDKRVVGQPIPTCFPHEYIYDSVSQFVNTGLA